MRIFAPGYGIDLGTANTVVYKPGSGIVLNEPSFMLMRPEQRKRAVLVGHEARNLTGRTSAKMVTVRPLQDGVITDLELARTFIKAIVGRCPRKPWEFRRAEAVIGIPGGATAIERRTLVEAAAEAGLAKVGLIQEPIAGAMGAGIDPLDARAHMVVDVGGGTAEVTAFCYGDVLVNRSVKIAGDEMTTALQIWLRQQKGIMVGELTAEEVKIALREAADLSQAGAIEIADPEADGSAEDGRRRRPTRGRVLSLFGRATSSGKPKRINLKPEEVAEALKPTVDSIVEVLQTCLEDLPPQTVSDIMEEGIMAFGGGSMLYGFDKRLEAAFDFKVKLAERPLTCVAEGAAGCLGNRDVIAAYSQNFSSK